MQLVPVNMYKTTATAGATHLTNACLAATQIGQFLGRSISQMHIRAAYIPAASALAITVISDIIEISVVNKCFHKHIGHFSGIPQYSIPHPNIKKLTNFLVRVVVGTALFAVGTAVTGGTLAPAMMAGAAMGFLVYVASKVSKVAADIFKYSVVTALLLLLHFTSLLESQRKGIDEFRSKVEDSLSPETLTLAAMGKSLFCKNK